MTTSLPIAPLPPTAPAAPADPAVPGAGTAAAAAQAQDYLDFQGLDALKSSAAATPNDPATLRAVAQQFEALMINMVLKSMREAKLGEGMLDSDQGKMYTEMLDQQLSLAMSQGKGLGIADLLVRSLTPHGSAAEAALNAYTKGLKRAQATISATGLEAAAGTVASVPGAGAVAATPEEFVSLVMPEAEAAGAALGVDPVALVAQAAVESNWGRQIPALEGRSSYNLFGIKADSGWGGSRAIRDTIEYSGGVPERRREPFRAYESVSHGFRDYVDFLRSNPRYATALQQGGDGASFITALHEAGYATDPAYSAKVTAVMRSPVLQAALANLKKPDDPPIY